MSAKRASPPVRWAVGTALVVFVGLWLFSAELFPGNSRLYDAIEAGDAARVQALLDSGADPNSRSFGLASDDEGNTRSQYSPLLYSIRSNQPEIAVLLLRAGADPDARHRSGYIAVIEAAEAGMVEVVRELIARGADLSVERPDGNTALHYGPGLMVQGRLQLKEHLDPEIRAMLQRAGSR
jgi:ankyrin repeat protein